MFDSVRKQVSDVTSSEINTIIDKGTTIKGDINGDGNVRIDGTVEGNVNLGGSVFIGESGCVNGNITSTNLTIFGIVRGNVNISNRLAICASGQLEGDSSTSCLNVEDGGQFNGHSKMTVSLA